MNILLAQATQGDPAAKFQFPTERGSTGIIWVIVAIGVVVAIVLIWAFFFREKPDELSGWGPSHTKYKVPEPRGESSSHGKRRRRRRRRDHRPRNPTLAETGGLPPVRSDQTSSDSGA